jgi:hypothetical protein
MLHCNNNCCTAKKQEQDSPNDINFFLAENSDLEALSRYARQLIRLNLVDESIRRRDA